MASAQQIDLGKQVKGNLPVSHLGGGTGASSTTCFFGDGQWKPCVGGTIPVFKTNNINNTTQSILNLLAGTNVTLSADTTGGVTISASGGGGGAGNPSTPLSSLQWNGGGSFSGAIQTTVSPGTGNNPAEVDIADFNAIRYNTGYNFSVSPSGSLSAGSNTVTTSCPAGIFGTDTAGNSKWHYIEIVSAGGDTSPNEPVLITGGTCTGGSASGTLTFSAAFAHNSGYTLTSATGGLQEAISEAGSGGPSSKAVILPSHTNLQLLAPVYTTNQRFYMEGGGSRLQCFFNDSCLIVGARPAFGTGNALVYQQQLIKDLTMMPGNPFWSVSPSGSVAGGTPTATLTVAACPSNFYPLIPNQLLWLAGASGGKPLARYGIGEYVTATGGTCLPGGSGTIIVQQASPGATNLSAHDAGFTLSNDVGAFIEDNANGSAFYNLTFISAGAGNQMGHGLQVDNDQSAQCYNCIDNSSFTLRGSHGPGGSGTDPDFVGSLFYGPGPFSINAGLLYITGGASGGPAACIDWWDGNDISVQNFVCQAVTSFFMRYLNALGGAGMRTIGPNVHFEGGSGTNPLGLIGIPTIVTSEGLGSSLSIADGTAFAVNAASSGTIASWPLYANLAAQSNTQYYWVVPHNNTLTGCTVTDCLGVPLPLGVAVTTDPSANNVTLTIPALSGANSYDILAVSSGTGTLFSKNPASPYGTGNFLVGTMTVKGSNCNTHGVCTFTDNVAPASRSTYTVRLSNSGSGTWYPQIYTWPGGIVSGPEGNDTATAAGESANYVGPYNCLTTTKFPPSLGVSQNDELLVSSTSPGHNSILCINQAHSMYIANFGGASSGFTNGATLIPSATELLNAKGRLNFGFQGTQSGAAPQLYDLITLYDSNFSKTMSQPQSDSAGDQYRPIGDAGDAAIGFDAASGGVSFRSPISLSDYINTLPDGINWVDRKTSNLVNFAVPVSSQSILSLGDACYGCSPFQPSGTQVTDNFNRADGSLGANWTVTGTATWSVVSNKAQTTTVAGYTNASYTGSAFANDQYAQARIIAFTGGGKAGVGVRMNSVNTDGYFCESTGAAAQMIKIVSGSQSNLVTLSVFPGAGDTIKIGVIGTAVTCYNNGAPIGSVTDSSLTTGSAGIQGVNSSVTVDNFKAGDQSWSTSNGLTVNNITISGTCTGTGCGVSAFNSITGGTNTTAAMVVGSGATLGVSGSGTIGATTLLGNTWASPGTIGGTSPGVGNFTNITTTGTLLGGAGAYTFLSNEVSAPGSPASGKEACYLVAGSGLQCKDSGGSVYTMQSSGSGSFYQTVLNSGSSLTQEPALNMTGAGVSCVDNSGASRTDCTITGGGGATAFSNITTGSNTAQTLTVGNTSTLTFSGTGVINANKLNGTAFAGTSGHVVSFGASNIPSDSGVVAANLVVASSPGAGIAHFAGSTQTVTSSAVSLTADVSGILSVANGGTNASTAAAARISLFPTASEPGDLVYCATYSAGCTSWALLAGNTSGTKVLQETSAGVPSWVTPSVTAAGMTLNRLQKASGSTTLTDSCMSDDGTTVTNNCPGGIVVGSGNPSIQTNTTSNTDLAGFGTMTAGTFTYSFLGTWISAPICVATDTAAANAVRVQTSTSTLTITGTSGDTVNYVCVART